MRTSNSLWWSASSLSCTASSRRWVWKRCPHCVAASYSLLHLAVLQKVAALTAEQLAGLRPRLTYFSRGCQLYHRQLQRDLAGKTDKELLEDQVCVVCASMSPMLTSWCSISRTQ